MLTRRLSERRSTPLTSVGREHVANYTLNETKTIHKKREACDRDNYTITHHDFCATVVFNTVAFEVFRKNLTMFYDRNQKYSTTLDEVKDQTARTTQDTFKVHDRTRRNSPHIYTINLYRTTCRVMVNGPHHLHFINYDLPGITDTIDIMDDRIRMMNSQVKLKLADTMVNKLSSHKDSPSNKLKLCGKETTEMDHDDKVDLPATETVCETNQEVQETRKENKLPENSSSNNELQDIDIDETEAIRLQTPTLNKSTVIQCRCEQEDTEEMMQCDECNKWIHFQCTALPVYMLKQLCDNESAKYTCQSCVTTDHMDDTKFNVNKDQSDRTSQMTYEAVTSVETQTEDNNMAEEENSELKSMITELHESAKTTKAQLQKSSADLRKLHMDSAVQTNKLASKEDEIVTLTKELTITKANLANKEKGLELEATKVNKSEKEVRKLTKEVSSLKVKIVDLEKDKENYEKQISAHLDINNLFEADQRSKTVCPEHWKRKQRIERHSKSASSCGVGKNKTENKRNNWVESKQQKPIRNYQGYPVRNG